MEHQRAMDGVVPNLPHILMAQGLHSVLNSTATQDSQFPRKTMNSVELQCRLSQGGDPCIHSTRGPLLSLPRANT